MKNLHINVVAMAISLACSAGAMAQAMTSADYKAARNVIATQYKADKGACASLSGNAKDICKAQAQGKEKINAAELSTRYHPSEDANYKLGVARAEADYSVAKEQCDDLAGNVKDVCVKQAKAAAISAKADAKAHKKIAAAHQSADEQSVKAQIDAADKGSEAQAKAREESLDARNDAAVARHAAEYKVAKEKCDALAGDAKGSCLKDAAARFGKS